MIGIVHDMFGGLGG